jgi:hypothetical protein
LCNFPRLFFLVFFILIQRKVSTESYHIYRQKQLTLKGRTFLYSKGHEKQACSYSQRTK